MVLLRDALWGLKAQSRLATSASSSEAAPLWAVCTLLLGRPADAMGHWWTVFSSTGSETQLRGVDRSDGEFQIGAQQQRYWQGSLR